MKAFKAILTAIGGIITTLIVVLGDDAISAEEVGVIVTEVLTVIGVYFGRNQPA